MQPCSDHSLPAHSINHWPTEMTRPVAVVVVVVAAFLAGLLTSEIAAEIAQNSADFYNLGRRRLPQQSLCLELIEPSGYSCSEHKVSITSLQNCPFSYLIVKFEIKWVALRYPETQMLKVRCFLVFFLLQIQTKDGYLLGLQRVSSRSGDLRTQLGPPVLLQHGLFMVKFEFSSLNFNKCKIRRWIYTCNYFGSMLCEPVTCYIWNLKQSLAALKL